MQRDKYEIIKDILESLPDYKFRIMYKANMDFRRLQLYIYLSLEKGLIYREHAYYYLTKKGEEYLKTMNSLMSLCKK